ncbi:MAG: hypothetical protein JO236_01550 [Mycobacterium sp.]|nr:hypothetical protein [Mycobacterium sp.]
MANASTAVVFLESHPAWIAARQLERERSDSMHRHPSARGRRRVSAGAASLGQDLRLCPDTPA